MAAAEASGALPRFSTNTRARWDFAMKIVGGDRGQQRIKGQGRAHRHNDESAVLYGDIDMGPRRNVCIGGEGTRDAEGKTVAPLANGDAHEASSGRARTGSIYIEDTPRLEAWQGPDGEPSTDGLVYVCDRPNDRIQGFKKDGAFVKEKQIAPLTRGDGSVWDIAFSRDAQQKYIYLADGKNERVYVMDRQSLEIITQFGDGGRQAGQFFAVHSIATDSRGNVFTTETYEGKRVQKFVYKGLGEVARTQGVLWRKP